ncbi:hypothetical protein HY504_01195 [Candidatus Wolfebacteria bacterium]|nr:hypothetical protein [Candidatus Wolfebacteria bacterium]
MPRGIISNKNTHIKTTLIALARIGLISIALTSPYIVSAIVKGYFKEKAESAMKKRARTLYELRRRKLISFKEMDDGSIEVIISQQGKELIRRFKLDEMKFRKPKQWDKKWRIVMYDIPHYQVKASNAFREKLKQLGLYPLQRSVWVSPYECREELEFLCSVFDIAINDHVIQFETLAIPREKEAKEFFELP